jgi:predicted Zn-dependent protease
VGDATERARHLELAATDPRLRESLHTFELATVLADFKPAIEAPDWHRAGEVAQSALELLEALPSDQRDTLDMQVLALQLRSVISKDSAGLLQAIDALYRDPALDTSQKRVLVWSKLHLLDRLGERQALQGFVGDLPAAGIDSVVDNEVYALLREFDSQGRGAELAQLSALWLPRLQPQPQLRRQVWLLQVKALRASGQDTRALEAIHGLLEAFPQSGDAWEQLAQQAEAMGDNFSAERALAHIAAADPEGSPRWLDVSLRRLQLLLAGAAETNRGCALYKRIEVYHHRLEQVQQQLLAGLVGASDCLEQGED